MPMVLSLHRIFSFVNGMKVHKHHYYAILPPRNCSDEARLQAHRVAFSWPGKASKNSTYSMPDAVGDIRLIRNKRKLEANTTQQYPLSVLYWITELSSSSNLKIFNQNIKFPEIIQVFENGRSILALNKSPGWHKQQQEITLLIIRGYVLDNNYKITPY